MCLTVIDVPILHISLLDSPFAIILPINAVSTALNPALRINKQLKEVLEFHNFGGSDAIRQARVIEVMSEVLLPSTPEFLRRYPNPSLAGEPRRLRSDFINGFKHIPIALGS